MADGLKQETVFRVARQNAGTRIAAFLPTAFKIQSKTAFLFFGAMAFVAFGGENGSDFGLKEFECRLFRFEMVAGSNRNR